MYVQFALRAGNLFLSVGRFGGVLTDQPRTQLQLSLDTYVIGIERVLDTCYDKQLLKLDFLHSFLQRCYQYSTELQLRTTLLSLDPVFSSGLY